MTYVNADSGKRGGFLGNVYQKQFAGGTRSREHDTRSSRHCAGDNPATFYRKTQGLSEFTRSEIQLIRYTLNLSTAEAEAIFFAPELT